MTEANNQSPEDEVIDVGRLFGELIDHKWLVIMTTAAFALGGIGYGMLATPVYQGDALVQVERRSTVSPLGDLGNVLGNETGLNTPAEIQILKSRMVLGQVADRLEKDISIEPVTVPVIGEYIVRQGIERPDFPIKLPYIGDHVLRSGIPQPGLIKGLPYVWGGESIEVARFELAEHLRGQGILVERDFEERYRVLVNEQLIGIGQVGGVSTFLDGDLRLRIEAFDAPPGVQFRLVKRHRSSAISSIGSRLNVSEEGGQNTSTGMLRLSMTGTDRKEIERSLNAVAETFLMQNVERQAAEADQSLAFLEEQAPELRSQLDAAEEDLNQYRMKLDSVDLSSEAQAAIDRAIEIERRLSELDLQEAELAQRFTPNHPSYQSLLRQKRHLQEERNHLDARVDELPEAQQEVLRLTRNVEVTQAIYVNVLNKIQELKVAKAGTIGNVRIIDRAQASGLVAPQRSRIIMLATLMGGVFAVGIILVRAFLRRGVESADQLERAGFPVYATIPLSGEQGKLVKRTSRHSGKIGKSVMQGVLATVNPTDTAIEALRGLRTSLHFAMLEGRSNRLMITGPSPGVGKTFTCINLAVVAAQAGMRALIIDADLRRGHIHHAFRKRSGSGLAEYLASQCELDEIIQDTHIDNLSLITRGSLPPNPSELLMQPRFAEAMGQVSKNFDLIIIDTPPVLAVTDASVVGKHSGISLLVARFERNPVEELISAKKRLENNGVNVQGAILNAIERKASTEARYYGYYPYSYQ